MKANTNIWDREYEVVRAIPSSIRRSPSKALLLLAELLHFERMETVLDIGCGNGRNAIYLAKKGCEVHALDPSQAALDRTQRAAAESNVAGRITTYNDSIGSKLHFSRESFDLILDSYVFCHFIDDPSRQHFREELFRLTKPGGYVFSSVLSKDDEYYRSIRQNDRSDIAVVTDPHNGVTKRLYAEEEIQLFYAERFRIDFFIKFEFTDFVFKKPFRRSVLVSVLTKDVA